MYQDPSYFTYQRPKRPAYGPGMSGATQASYPSFVGRPVGQANQAAPSPPNYFNDPTLAPGATGSGTPGWSPPPGARPVPNNLWGGIPNDLARKGWRRMNGPDGKAYWVPPGTQFGAAPSYTTYGPNVGGGGGGGANANAFVPSTGAPSYVTY